MQLCVFRRPRVEAWERRPLHLGVEAGPCPGAVFGTYTRVLGVEAPGPPAEDGPYRRVARAIRAYRVFPPWLVSGVLRRAPVEEGDTVGIFLHVLPGVGILFAARVAHTFDGEHGGVWRSGFTYLTVQGHPEKGEETFSVEKDVASGRVTVSLRSWSVPGMWLTRVVDPFVRFMQKLASRLALRHLQRVADGR